MKRRRRRARKKVMRRSRGGRLAGVLRESDVTHMDESCHSNG